MANEKTDTVENTTTEVNAIVHYKDAAGNVVKIYPQTKAENVTDLEDNYLKKTGGEMNGDIIMADGTMLTNDYTSDIYFGPNSITLELNHSKFNLSNEQLNINIEDNISIYSDEYIDISSERGTTINNVVTPTSDKMAANKKYVDDSVSNIAPLLITDNDIFEAVDYDNSITLFKKIDAAVSNGINVYYSPLYDLEQDAAEIYVLTEWYGTEGTFVRIYENTVYYAFICEGVPTVELSQKEFVPMRKAILLSSSGWAENGDVYTQTATVLGVSATETEQEIHVTPAITSMSAYMEAGIYASGQAANKLTFTAAEVPTGNLTVYALIRTI